MTEQDAIFIAACAVGAVVTTIAPDVWRRYINRAERESAEGVRAAIAHMEAKRREQKKPMTTRDIEVLIALLRRANDLSGDERAAIQGTIDAALLELRKIAPGYKPALFADETAEQIEMRRNELLEYPD